MDNLRELAERKTMDTPYEYGVELLTKIWELFRSELGIETRKVDPDDLWEVLYKKNYGFPDAVIRCEEKKRALEEHPYFPPSLFNGYKEKPMDHEYLQEEFSRLDKIIKFNKGRLPIPKALEKSLSKYEDNQEYYYECWRDEHWDDEYRYGVPDSEDDTPDEWFDCH